MAISEKTVMLKVGRPVRVRCVDRLRFSMFPGTEGSDEVCELTAPLLPGQCHSTEALRAAQQHIVPPKPKFAELLELPLDERARLLNTILSGAPA